MRCAAFFAVALGSMSLIGQTASACVPIDYRGEFPRGGVVEQMVVRAATIQVMRATARTFAWRDPYDAYPAFYTFEFEPVDTWKGWDLGALRINGQIAGAEQFDWTGEVAMVLLAEGRAWEHPDLIEMYQAWVEPVDIDSLGCRLHFSFRVGDTYLVFRDATGAVLEQSFRMTIWGQERWFRGPVVMPMSEPNNRWARAVRVEISNDWSVAP
jgi:hypothetical protein